MNDSEQIKDVFEKLEALKNNIFFFHSKSHRNYKNIAHISMSHFTVRRK